MLTKVFPLRKRVTNARFCSNVLVLMPVPTLSTKIRRGGQYRRSSCSSASFMVPDRTQRRNAFSVLPKRRLTSTLRHRNFANVTRTNSPIYMLLLNNVPLTATGFNTSSDHDSNCVREL